MKARQPEFRAIPQFDSGRWKLRLERVPVHKSSKIAHYALDNDLTLKEAALKLGFVTEDVFNQVVDPAKMVHPYVAKAS